MFLKDPVLQGRVQLGLGNRQVCIAGEQHSAGGPALQLCGLIFCLRVQRRAPAAADRPAQRPVRRQLQQAWPRGQLTASEQHPGCAGQERCGESNGHGCRQKRRCLWPSGSQGLALAVENLGTRHAAPILEMVCEVCPYWSLLCKSWLGESACHWSWHCPLLLLILFEIPVSIFQNQRPVYTLLFMQKPQPSLLLYLTTSLYMLLSFLEVLIFTVSVTLILQNLVKMTCFLIWPHLYNVGTCVPKTLGWNRPVFAMSQASTAHSRGIPSTQEAGKPCRRCSV